MTAYHPHPDVWILGAVLLLGYLWLGRAARGDGPRREPPGPLRTAAFVAGALLLVASEEWPLHDLAETHLFSAHMVQHMLFAYVVPPLLLLGTPAWMMRLLVGRGARRAVYRFVTRPLVAFVLLNGAIAAMHWEPVVDLQLTSPVFHLAFHALMLVAGLAMWAVVLDPLPEFARLTEPFKMMYLFLQSIIPTVPASFLTFSEGVLYDVYAGAPRLWPWLDAVADQRIAGLIMKVGGGLLLWTVIAVIFFRWNAAEENSKEIETMSWDDFERELEAWDMRKP